jgi:hypothetical protein
MAECVRCWFLERALRMQARAEAEPLPCLAKPMKQVAHTMESTALGYECLCQKPMG